jgi:hypothetical protein
VKTRIVTLKKNDSYVRLIGCCHIGSKAYFNELQDYCKGTVLFEGVSGTNKDDSLKLSLTKIYRLLASILDLSYQNDTIIYQDTWIGSDITEDQLLFLESKIISRLYALMNDTDYKTLEAKFKKKKHRIKFIFKFMFPILSRIIGNNKVLVHFRNNKVLLDIIHYLALNQNVSVLYGEGHLNDLISRLKQLKFEVVNVKKVNINLKEEKK